MAADLKHFAAEQLVTRLPSVTLGERLMMARRASETVAAALLLDKEPRVAHTALENSRLTEAAVIRAVLRPNAGAAFIEAVCHHPKWSADARFAWHCCAARTLHSRAPWNFPAAFLRRCCATFCIHRVCRKKSKPTCGKI